MNTYFKGIYTILGKIEHASEAKFKFNITVKNNVEIVIEVIPHQGLVESFFEGTISEELRKFISETGVRNLDDLSPELKAEISNITSNMNQAVRKVLYNIKYWLRCDSLEENLFSIKAYQWSEDKNSWKSFPLVPRCTIDIDYVLSLNEDRANIVKNYIQRGIEPFISLRHLHRAKAENIPRYKWIDATIAAELAIKEFFIELKPELESLLLEIQSPPLYKLYGNILEAYTGKRSPYVSKLQKGSERRNILLHRPQGTDITLEEANEYIHDVENVIYHLLTLLYPDDGFIRSCYRN